MRIYTAKQEFIPSRYSSFSVALSDPEEQVGVGGIGPRFTARNTFRMVNGGADGFHTGKNLRFKRLGAREAIFIGFGFLDGDLKGFDAVIDGIRQSRKGVQRFRFIEAGQISEHLLLFDVITEKVPLDFDLTQFLYHHIARFQSFFDPYLEQYPDFFTFTEGS